MRAAATKILAMLAVVIVVAGTSAPRSFGQPVETTTEDEFTKATFFGKKFADLGEYASAYEQYAKANALKPDQPAGNDGGEKRNEEVGEGLKLHTEPTGRKRSRSGTRAVRLASCSLIRHGLACAVYREQVLEADIDVDAENGAAHRFRAAQFLASWLEDRLSVIRLMHRNLAAANL